MKFMKRSGTYKGRNVTFDPQTLSAVSYGWWEFVRVIRGRTIFKAYRYSNTTCKHQSKVRLLMRSLGIKIDHTVSIPDSLSKVSGLRDLSKREKEQARIDAENAEMKRKARNEKARFRRAKAKLENCLENEKHFRDYKIEPKTRFGQVSAMAVHQQVDPDSMDQDIENALYNFHRDGFSMVVFYV